MILNGNERSGAARLARHLMNAQDNEHVELHDLRGFVADDLHGALLESEAIAKGTRCEKHLFSLSLNPPQDADVPIEAFEAAIEKIEKQLGLENQPRAIVFHEKEGRRHAHAVWSKIDGEKMKAVNLSFYKRDLTRLSKELFLEHGWSLPNGLKDQRLRDPLSFTLEEWQQGKRTGLGAKQTKTLIRDCWNSSDTRQSFEAALR
ncbi:MAG: relaxase/mobilization nuclease domain-containing protein, partial [Pseudomonadota bacterium]